MEEAREKIELFRNYYLVCFRSFDQDPYSPTHLDPSNMYVVVFREGTLSVGVLASTIPGFTEQYHDSSTFVRPLTRKTSVGESNS